MLVTVHEVKIPAMSTIGYGYGVTESGQLVKFAGDHRPMRDLGMVLQERARAGEPAPDVDLDDWQVLSVEPPRRKTSGKPV